MKPLETTLSGLKPNILSSKDKLEKLIQDLKEYLVEDDYPLQLFQISTLDTEDFAVLQDDDFGNKREGSDADLFTTKSR